MKTRKGRLRTKRPLSLKEAVRIVLERNSDHGTCRLSDADFKVKLAELIGAEQVDTASKGMISGHKFRARQRLKLSGARKPRRKKRSVGDLLPAGTVGIRLQSGAKRLLKATAIRSRRGKERQGLGRLLRLRSDHPALAERKTIYVTLVRNPSDSKFVLVSGFNNLKIGRRVEKGAWAGFPIFSLTLEERATCPATCHHWDSCMGNNMHYSKRYRHGKELERKLEAELAVLQTHLPDGFVVRLHILGDFYSVEYVELWRKWLETFSGLRIFGYTRWWPETTIGAAVLQLRTDMPDRFAIRFSRATPKNGAGEVATVPNTETADRFGAIVCPAERNQTETCGTCTLCWTSERLIAFIHHGRVVGRNRKVSTPRADTESTA